MEVTLEEGVRASEEPSGSSSNVDNDDPSERSDNVVREEPEPSENGDNVTTEEPTGSINSASMEEPSESSNNGTEEEQENRSRSSSTPEQLGEDCAELFVEGDPVAADDEIETLPVEEFGNLGDRVLDMLNFKIVRKQPGDKGYIEDEHLPSDARVYAANFCDMNDEIEELKEKLETQMGKLEEAKDHLKQAEEESKIWREALEDKEKELSDALSKNTELNQELEAFDRELDDYHVMKEEYKEKERKVEQLEEQMNDLQDKLDAAEENVRNLKEIEQNLQIQVERQVVQTSKLKEHVSQFETDCTKYKMDLRAAEDKIRQLEADNAEFKVMLESKDEKLKVATANASKVQVEYDAAQEKMKDLMVDCVKYQMDMQKAKDELQKETASSLALKEDLQQANRTIEEETSNLVRLRAELETARNTIAAQETRLKEAEEIIIAQKDAHTNLESNYHNLVQLNKKQDTNVSTLERRISERDLIIKRLETDLNKEQRLNTEGQVRYRTLRDTVFSMQMQIEEFVKDWKQYVGGFGGKDKDSSEENGCSPVEMLERLGNRMRDKFRFYEDNQRELRLELQSMQEMVVQLQELVGRIPPRTSNLPVSSVIPENGGDQEENGGEGGESVEFEEIPEVPIRRPKVHGVDRDRYETGYYCLCNSNWDYGNDRNLGEHIKFFKDNYQFNCFKCPIRFCAMAYLKLHLKKKHSTILRPVKIGCTMCSSLFPTWKKLWLHKRTVHTIRACKRTLDPKRKEARLTLSNHVTAGRAPSPVVPQKIVLRRNSNIPGSDSYTIVSATQNGPRSQETPATSPSNSVDCPSPSVPPTTTAPENSSGRLLRSSTRAAAVIKTPVPLTTPPPVLSPIKTLSSCSSPEEPEIPVLSAVSVRVSEDPWSPPPDHVDGSGESEVDEDEKPEPSTSSTGAPDHAIDTSKYRLGYYFCICGTQTRKITTLKYHVRTFSQPWLFPCSICSTRCFSFGTLTRHYKAAHRSVPKSLSDYVTGCADCGKMFKSTKALPRHRKNGQCKPPKSENTGSGSIMKAPVRRNSVSKLPVPPSSRDSNSSEFAGLLSAIGLQKRKKPDPEQANQTSEMTTPSENGVVNKPEEMNGHVPDIPIKREVDLDLPAHRIDHSRRREGEFCSCGYQAHARVTLKSHIRRKMAQNWFVCNVRNCGQSFKTTSELRTHMRDVHRKLYNLSGCQRCGETFKTKEQLNQHKRDAHPQFLAGKKKQVDLTMATPAHVPEMPPVPASFSPRRRRNRTVPRRTRTARRTRRVRRTQYHATNRTHAEDISKRNVGYFCVCKSAFSTPENLYSHIRHFTGERHFKCQVCSREFVYLAHLKCHLFMAHGRNDVDMGKGCSWCGKWGFKSKKDLATHRKVAHSATANRLERSRQTLDNSPTRRRLATHYASSAAASSTSFLDSLVSERDPPSDTESEVGPPPAKQQKIMPPPTVPTPVITPTVPTPVTTPTLPTPVTTSTVPTPVITPTVPTPVITPTVPTPVITPTVPTPVTTPTVPTSVITPTVPTPVTTSTVPTPVITPTVPTPVTTPQPSTSKSTSSITITLVPKSISSILFSTRPSASQPSLPVTPTPSTSKSPSVMTITPVTIPGSSKPSQVVFTGPQPANPESSLERHAIDLSTNWNEYRCKCGETFGTNDLLKQHILSAIMDISQKSSRNSTKTPRPPPVTPPVMLPPPQPTQPLPSTSSPSTPQFTVTATTAGSPAPIPHTRCFSPGGNPNKYYCTCGKDYASEIMLQSHIAAADHQQHIPAAVDILRNPETRQIIINKRVSTPPQTPTAQQQPGTSRRASVIISTNANGMTPSSSSSTPFTKKRRITIRDSIPYPTLPQLSIERIYQQEPPPPSYEIPPLLPATAARRSSTSTTPATSGVQPISEPNRNSVTHVPDVEREKEEGVFACKCRLTFPNKTMLFLHVRKYITYKFSCKSCTQTFVTSTQLSKHVQDMHRMYLNASNACKVCTETFSSNMELCEHYRIVHNRGQAWETKHCPSPRQSTFGDAYGNQNGLISAGEDDHAQVQATQNNLTKKFQCKCTLTFEGQKGLDRHIRKMTGRLRYSCDFCPLILDSMVLLRKHENQEHNTNGNLNSIVKIEPSN